MAEQILRGVITKAVAEATRIVIQTMAEMQAQKTPKCSRTQTRQSHPKAAYLRLGGPKQIYGVEGIYSGGGKCLINIQCTRARQNSHGKKLVREKRAPLNRNINSIQKRRHATC